MPNSTHTPSAQAPLVIVGGGVAGLVIATALGKQSAASDGKLPPVVLIDRDSAHVWKPMLHTIAAGTSDVHQQQTTFVAQAHASHFRYEPGEMRGIDRAAHQIQLAALQAPDGRVLIPERKLRYSKLIIAVGSPANDFGMPGAAARLLARQPDVAGGPAERAPAPQHSTGLRGLAAPQEPPAGNGQRPQLGLPATEMRSITALEPE